MNKNHRFVGVATMLFMATLCEHVTAGTDCGVSSQFTIDNVIGGISCDVSGLFAINNVIPDLMCDVSATFTINNLPAAIPTVSQWGAGVMTLLLATAGTIIYRRRHRIGRA